MPFPSLTVVCAPMSAGDVAVTVTPGSTAPCASFTIPMRLLGVTWARAVWPIPSSAAISSALILRLIVPSMWNRVVMRRTW